jgi:dipeptidyl aminopeptidase/acylaminoacyl peptidase
MTRAVAPVLSFVCALALFARTTPAQAPAPFTLEQVMNRPFVSELAAAPSGAKFAWIQNDAGVRNIWVAEPAPSPAGSASSAGSYTAHRATAYTADDGIDIGELAWTPDAQSIVYTRGADLETDGTDPNPTSNPAGPDHAIWIVAIAGGEPRKIAEGTNPVVSPRDGVLVYLNDSQIWSAKLDGTDKPAQLIHAHGRAAALRWSPDGAHLAFVSARGDHSFIGVYTLAGKSLRFLDPSVDRDGQPAWSPDGRSIAFRRIPADTLAFTFGPRRSGQPWSLRVADVATGHSREIWHAKEGPGSVAHDVVAGNQIFWGAGDRIVFAWEGDGWLHLYSVPASGGSAELLTPGTFEVEHVSLAPGGKEILYSSNQDDVDRRHVWRVSVAGGKPTAVTQVNAAGIEWSPVAASEGTSIAVLHSGARHPSTAAVVDAKGALHDLNPGSVPASFPAAALVDPQQVIFSAADGLSIHGQLFLPSNLKPGERRPALVFFHGGSRRQMLLGWHYMDYYNNAYAMNQYLASRGYIVLSVNYRSGIGYGMEFREALNYGATGASEFNDVLGAGVYLRSRADVDPHRIGIWGGSYGGYLTALGLARASDLFAAGVDFHGVHNWNIEIHHFVPAYDPQANPDAARIALESSPIYSVKTWRSPVLFIHGDDDRNVPFTETVRMIEALRKQNVEIEELIIPDEIHDFLREDSWLRAYRATADYFDRHLRDSH